jgi:hypothetical protein
MFVLRLRVDSYLPLRYREPLGWPATGGPAPCPVEDRRGPKDWDKRQTRYKKENGLGAQSAAVVAGLADGGEVFWKIGVAVDGSVVVRRVAEDAAGFRVDQVHLAAGVAGHGLEGVVVLRLGGIIDDPALDAPAVRWAAEQKGRHCSSHAPSLGVGGLGE